MAIRDISLVESPWAGRVQCVDRGPASSSRIHDNITSSQKFSHLVEQKHHETSSGIGHNNATSQTGMSTESGSLAKCLQGDNKASLTKDVNHQSQCS